MKLFTFAALAGTASVRTLVDVIQWHQIGWLNCLKMIELFEK